jgi:hypothetical protein
MPNALGILVHLSDAVKWDPMGLSFNINELKSPRALLRECDFL